MQYFVRMKLISSEKNGSGRKNTYDVPKLNGACVNTYSFDGFPELIMVTLATPSARNAVHLCVVHETRFSRCEFVIDRIKVRVHDEEMECIY